MDEFVHLSKIPAGSKILFLDRRIWTVGIYQGWKKEEVALDLWPDGYYLISSPDEDAWCICYSYIQDPNLQAIILNIDQEVL